MNDSGATPWRVLVVDDEPGHRLICRIALEDDGGFTCVGEAFDGRRAIERARELQPDLVVLDLRMPIMDGLEALPHILDAAPGTRVVVWTNEGELQRELARERGANGAVSKLAPARDLVHALHQVARPRSGAAVAPALG